MLSVFKKFLASFFLSMHINVYIQAKIKTPSTFALPQCPSHILQPAPHSIQNANTVPIHLSSLLLYIPPVPLLRPLPPPLLPFLPLHLRADGVSRHAVQTCLPVCFDIVA